MKKNIKQNSLFDLEPVSNQVKKAVATKKKIIPDSYELSGESGLNGSWRNFGDYIANGRNNKTI